ncbi:uncharacterized protein [Neodiprion pinetum]|uniref:uncharacterized protein n=1 Tax=Neodiprion pinetum TaxID=441929 RepID=UPI003721B1B2
MDDTSENEAAILEGCAACEELAIAGEAGVNETMVNDMTAEEPISVGARDEIDSSQASTLVLSRPGPSGVLEIQGGLMQTVGPFRLNEGASTSGIQIGGGRARRAPNYDSDVTLESDDDDADDDDETQTASDVAFEFDDDADDDETEGAYSGNMGRESGLESEAASEKESSQAPDDGADSLGNRFTVIGESTKFIRKFAVTGRELRMKIAAPESGVNLVKWLEDAFRDLHAYAVATCRSSDYIGFTFSAESFNHGPAWLSFRPVRDSRYSDLWKSVFSVAQSASEFGVDSVFTVTVHSVGVPEGRGKPKPITHVGVLKKSVVQIVNSDGLCLPRALVVAKAHAERGPNRSGALHKHYEMVRFARSSFQRAEARNLVANAGVEIPPTGCIVHEIAQFQNYLAREGFLITVYELGRLGTGEAAFYDGTAVVRANGTGDVRHRLNLLYYPEEQHYCPIVNLTAAAAGAFFCQPCNRKFNNGYEHRCSVKCPQCLASPPCNSQSREIECPDCRRVFRGNGCLEYHRRIGSFSPRRSVCATLRICRNCKRFVNLSRRAHICETRFCVTCRCNPYNHYCFMTPLKDATRPKRYIFIFYDFETQQCETVDGDATTNIHVPNLCVAQQVCTQCIHDPDISNGCSACGLVREFVFRREPVKELVDFATRPVQDFARIVCIAHNAKGFDAQFILRHMVERDGNPPQVILSGSKIIMLETGHTRFLDSLAYMPMALSALPKAFGLPTTSVKGVFPHLFNTPENVGYVGPLPAAKFYSPDTMSSDARAEFYSWYNEAVANDHLFDFDAELLSYCRSDVDILRRILPPGGYRLADAQSRKALEWLVVKERELGIDIRHAGNGREFRIPETGRKVDGYHVAGDGTRHVYEFYGCFWHGCRKCLRINRNRRSVNGETLDRRYEETRAKISRMRELGYRVTEHWECVFDRSLRENEEMREYVATHPLIAGTATSEALNPRDAFYGGRTGNAFRYYEVKTDATGNAYEEIRYVDVCSLYPFICKNGRFPVGHPTVYVGEECELLTGSSECRQDECRHDDEAAREFEGTWVSIELKKAVEMGYKIRSIREIWSYTVTSFDPTTRQGGHFAGYIDTFLKIKQEASGWPAECEDESARMRYLDEYERVEGIRLDRDRIAKNPGMRSVSKLCLNSFWGKFGQRENLVKTEVIKTRRQLLELLTNPEVEVSGLLPVNDEVLYVRWSHAQHSVEPSALANVVIASYTTAQARLKLFSFLEKLDRRVLYYDTDSVIYTRNLRRPNEYEPPTGNFLGDLTDELASYGRGSFIRAFVSGGPKFYAFIIKRPNGKEVEICKVKGISLNHATSSKINFVAIKRMVPLYDGDKSIEYREGLPQHADYEGDKKPKLLVIHDLMREASNNVVVDLFTKVCHHKNLSVFYITQNLFHKGNGQRDISLNANYIVFFKNPRDRAQIQHLARQVYPEDPRFLQEAYHDATAAPHGYLLFDLKQSTPENCRFRSNIFPSDDNHYVYVPRKDIKVTNAHRVPVVQL